MIKTLTVPSPTLRLEISAGTVVKITAVVIATRFTAHVVSEVVSPYMTGISDAVHNKIMKLKREAGEIEDKKEEEKSELS